MLRDGGATLLRNPILMAPVAGITWSFGGMPLPKLIDVFGSVLAPAAGFFTRVLIGLFSMKSRCARAPGR